MTQRGNRGQNDALSAAKTYEARIIDAHQMAGAPSSRVNVGSLHQQAYDNGNYRLGIRKFIASAPEIISCGTSDVWSNALRFQASIFPNGLPTTVAVEYGLTNSFGNSVSVVQNPSDGFAQVGVYTPRVDGLSPNTTYHYRAVVSNSLGTTFSDDMVVSTPLSPQGWSGQNTGETVPIVDIAILDDEKEIALEGQDRILRTTDGGTHWSEQLCWAGGSFNAIASRTVDAAVAVGWGMYETSDAGLTWIRRDDISQWLSDICFVDESSGTAVGGPGLIIHTTDGGIHWSTQSCPSTEYLRGVSFPDKTHGTIVGQGGTIIHTTDEGATWLLQAGGSNEILTAVAFADSNVGIIVGYNGIIRRTTNGGNTWLVPSTSTWYSFEGVVMLDPLTGYAAGSNGTILKTR